MKTKRLLLLMLIGFSVMAGTSYYFYHQPGSENNISKAPGSMEFREMMGALQYNLSLKADLTNGKIDPALVAEAWNQANAMKKYRSALNLEWEVMGPDNVGGRTRALVIDKDNPKILYAGGVSGGIFKSLNYGQFWERKVYSAELGGLVISCMAQANDASGTLFAGTGELFFTMMSGSDGNLTSGSIGGGVYKSTDRGETWQLISSTNPTVAGQTMWTNVQAIAIHPTNPSLMYAATYSGLMRSTNGGDTWTKLGTMPDGVGSHIFVDVKFSPNGNYVYAASYGGNKSRIFKAEGTTDATFTRLGTDALPSYQACRYTIAISPSNQDVLYVCAAANGVNRAWYSLEGVFKSVDNGANWTKIVDGGTEAEPFGRSGAYQGQYDNCIAVDPYNPDRIFVGGVDMYTYADGMWYKSSSVEEFVDVENKVKNPYYVHADKHNIFFDLNSNPARMYIVTDGGIFVSTNFTTKYPSYSQINLNYITTQFYGIAAHPRGDITGGTQDQGSMRIEFNGLTGKSAEEILGNDGFYTEISKFNPDYYFFEFQNGNLYRSKNRGKDIESMTKLNKVYENSANFNVPYRLWEAMVDSYYYDTNGVKHDSLMHISRLFMAVYDPDSNKSGLMVTPNATDFLTDSIKWYRASTGINFRPMCVEYTEDGNTVYIGGVSGSSGRLYRVTNLRNVEYKYNAEGKFFPYTQNIKTDLIGTWSSRSVCGIGVSPVNGNVVVVTLGNYVSGLDHIYVSTNAQAETGVTFNSIQGNLPNFPVYDAVINAISDNYDTIIIATEMGIWSTKTASSTKTWTEENSGMHRAPVFMLRQIKPESWHKGYVIFAGTHGMGIYRATTLCPNLGISKPARADYLTLSVYPNPASVSTTFLISSSKSDIATARIYNLNGQMVQNFRINISSGENSVPVKISQLPAGTYLVNVQTAERSMTSRFVVVK